MRLTWLFLGLIFLASRLSAQSALIGASREDIIDYYGQPVSQLKTPSREVLVYKQGRVVLENGKVTESSLPLLAGMESFTPSPEAGAKPAATRAVEPGRSASSFLRKSSTGWKLGVGTGSIDLRWVGSVILAALLIALLGWRIWRKKSSPVPAAANLPRETGPMVGSLKPLSKRPPVLTRPPIMSSLPEEPLVPGVLPPSPASTNFQPKELLLTERLLHRLEWRRLEMLVSRYFEQVGLVAERLQVSADGTVDINFFERDSDRPSARIRCRAWQTEKLGTKLVREFAEELVVAGIERGQIITSGAFTGDARELADLARIDLITGPELVERVNALTPTLRTALLEEITAGDFSTPTCVKCDVKMVLRGDGERPVWACRNLPLCNATLLLRAAVD